MKRIIYYIILTICFVILIGSGCKEHKEKKCTLDKEDVLLFCNNKTLIDELWKHSEELCINDNCFMTYDLDSFGKYMYVMKFNNETVNSFHIEKTNNTINIKAYCFNPMNINHQDLEPCCQTKGK